MLRSNKVGYEGLTTWNMKVYLNKKLKCNKLVSKYYLKYKLGIKIRDISVEDNKWR